MNPAGESPNATLEVDLPDEAATAALARRLAPLLAAGDVLALAGDLGAGKTSFARALINALPGGPGSAGSESEEVPSPTFTLEQVYERAPAPVWHVDLYRLARPEDAEELGLEEAFAEAIVLIEWPERLAGRLPPDRLEIRLSYGVGEDARRAALTGRGAWGPRLAAAGIAGAKTGGTGTGAAARRAPAALCAD